MQKLLILLIGTLFFAQLSAQIQHEGIPFSFNKSTELTDLSSVKMPTFNLQERLNEDKEISPIRFAKDFEVNFNLNNSGMWDELSNGDKVWRLQIKSEGALSLNFIFKQFILPDGAKLYIYTPDKSQILGAFTKENNKASKKLATSLIDGDEAIIEYNLPSNTSEIGEVEISKVNHGYLEVFSELKDGRFGLSGDCNVDINCEEGNNWQKEKHAVCRIIMGGIQLCTGSLINNTSNDGTPYFLTANHCTTASYDEWVFYFNYESPTCDGTDGSTTQTTSGCELKATSSVLDFCLVEMSEYPPKAYYPYYLGWNNSVTPAQKTTSIHHPQGDVKKISFDYDSPVIDDYTGGYADFSHWKIEEWDVGTTEGGSSGSPLLDENHRIIGDLTGGEAYCGNSINDYYTRFDLAWDSLPESNKQLKHWLDPENSGVNHIDGYFPYYSINTFDCDTSSNIGDGENIQGYDFNTAWGYWTGHNEYSFLKFADAHETTNTKYIQGLIMPILRAYNASDNSYITVKIWDDNNGIPGNELASKDVLISQFSQGNWKYVELNSYVEIQGKYYVGYEIYYNTPVDTFAVHQVTSRGDGGLNTAYVFYNNAWKAFPEISSLYTSLGIKVLICTITGQEEIKNDLKNKISLYPNPTNSIFYINTKEKINDVNIYDIYGRVVKHESNYNNAGFDCSNLPNGIYIVEILSQNSRNIEKILIAK